VASWYDFALAIQQEGLALGILRKTATIFPIATEDYPTPACRPRYSVLDCSVTRVVHGTAPDHWRAELSRTLRESADA
jgi:dTDP-4-dehydrorhamnose reductase